MPIPSRTHFADPISTTTTAISPPCTSPASAVRGGRYRFGVRVVWTTAVRLKLIIVILLNLHDKHSFCATFRHGTPAQHVASCSACIYRRYSQSVREGGCGWASRLTEPFVRRNSHSFFRGVVNKFEDKVG